MLERISDNKVFATEDTRKLTDLLKIETIGSGLGRYGCTLTRYLKQFDEETNKLPRYLARIRTETKKKSDFSDIEAKSGFMTAQNITEEKRTCNNKATGATGDHLAKNIDS